MVPKINQQGHSFTGVMAYLMHDKKAQTSERVAWAETGNMFTNNPEKAARVMAFTDKSADTLKQKFGGSAVGRKTESGAVYHYSLSWAQNEQPDRQHQKQQALATLEKLGLDNHQYVLVSHNETEHAHVHIVINLTNPETGKRAHLGLDKKALQAWALEYEREHGLHCHMREENIAKRKQGLHVKHQDRKQDYSDKVTRAYYAADNGKAFANALNAEGLQLAAARRGNGFVIVDEKGDIQKLGRQLQIEERGKAKTAQINAKLSDLDRSTLPDADVLAKQAKEQQNPFDRDAQEAEQQKTLADAAYKAGEAKAEAIKAEELNKAAAEREKIKVEVQRQREEKEAAKQAKYAAIQRRIDEKTAKSRKTWNIDKLTKERDSAAQYLEDTSGFWERVTGKQHSASEKLDAAQKTLDERQGRFKADIKAFNSKRPEWLAKQELERAGFETEKDICAGESGGTMNKGKTSREEWEEIAGLSHAQEEAAKAQQQNIPIEKLRAQEEARRQDAMFPKVETPELEGEEHLEGLRKEYQAAINEQEQEQEVQIEPLESEKEQYSRLMERSEPEIDGISADHENEQGCSLDQDIER